jgi:hypothetical protein
VSYRGRLSRLLPVSSLSFAEDFYAERIVVVDALERLQEAGQVDDTFAGQQTLIIVDLLWRQVRRVIEMDVHDAIAAGGNDVRCGGSCVVPVPGIEQQSDFSDRNRSELLAIKSCLAKRIPSCRRAMEWSQTLRISCLMWRLSAS